MLPRAGGEHGDHANLSVVDDNEDEEETIELRRSGGGARSPSQDTPPPNSHESSAAATSSSPRREVQQSRTNFSRSSSSPRHELRLPSVPLRETFQSVLSATTHVVSHLDTVADSVAEAMSLLQHPFGGGGSSANSSSQSQNHLPPHQRDRMKELRETYDIEPKLQEAKDAQTRLKLQALWQLLLTGFEARDMDYHPCRVLKFAIGKRARKRVLWLAVDGKLFLTPTKNDRNPNKFIFLADIYKVQKGSEAQSFTKSQSWREARGGGKEQLCLSIHGTSSRREKTLALQVLTSNVRNILAENLLALLQRMKSDADGEFPFVAQKVIAQQYAATGEVLGLSQVEDILLREEDEKRSGGAPLKECSPDKKKAITAASRSSSRVLSRKREVGSINDVAKDDNDNDDDSNDDGDDDGDDVVLRRDDPRGILG